MYRVAPKKNKGECIMKTIFDVRNELDTIQSRLVVLKIALMGQGPETGEVGPKAIEDVFTDIADRMQEAMEALDNIRKERDA